MALCLSVRPSVCQYVRQCFTKMANHRMTVHRESRFLVPKISAKFDRGHPQRGRQMQVQNLVQVKLAHTRLPSVGFRSWSRFLAVSLQVMWVINLPVGCHYFPPGLQLPSQRLRGLLPVLLLGEQRHDGCTQLPKTVTRQRRDCDLNPGPTTPESSTLTTRLPSHPMQVG